MARTVLQPNSPCVPVKYNQLELTGAVRLLAANLKHFAPQMLEFYVEIARSADLSLQLLACKGLQ